MNWRRAFLLIGMAAAIVCLSGCARMIYNMLPVGEPPPTSEQLAEMERRSAEARKPKISVTYFAPVIYLDDKGDEWLSFLKKAAWSVNLRQETRYYLCASGMDGSNRREVCHLPLTGSRDWYEGSGYGKVAQLTLSVQTGIGLVGNATYNGETVTLFKTDGSRAWTLHPEGGTGQFNYPALSMDGQWVVFDEEGEDRAPKSLYRWHRIAKCHPDGGGYTIVADRDGWEINMEPAISPDGNRIAYVHRDPRPKGGPHLWIMDADGSNKRNLGVWGNCPSWSSDGTRLFFSGCELVDPSTGKSERTKTSGTNLPHSARLCRSGFVFPEGNGIGFVSLDGANRHLLFADISRPAKPGDIEKEEFRW